MSFLNPEIKLASKHNFYLKVPIRKFDLMLPDVDLTFLYR